MEISDKQQTGDGQQAQSSQAARQEWIKPRGGEIPRPTYMPLVLALGAVGMLWGIVTTYLVSLVGLALFVVGISGWIGELRRERRHSRTP